MLKGKQYSAQEKKKLALIFFRQNVTEDILSVALSL